MSSVARGLQLGMGRGMDDLALPPFAVACHVQYDAATQTMSIGCLVSDLQVSTYEPEAHGSSVIVW